MPSTWSYPIPANPTVSQRRAWNWAHILLLVCCESSQIFTWKRPTRSLIPALLHRQSATQSCPSFVSPSPRHLACKLRGMEEKKMPLHKSRASQTLPINLRATDPSYCQTAGPTNRDTASAPISGRVQETSSRNKWHCNGWKKPRAARNLACRTFWRGKLISGYRDITGRWGLPRVVGVY
jgi:hypothetical protein